ncbi:MAG TPA: hypothetical protein VI112_08550 [Bacteroidia bacterium]|jgi:hypothetical protein
MKNFYKIGSLSVMIALVITVILPVSCKKETTCYANITVVDATSGLAVSGATVKLDCSTCPTTSTLQTDQTTTDASGRASFTFKYEAVLDIHVNLQTRSATGVIKLEAGKTVEKTVSLP